MLLNSNIGTSTPGTGGGIFGAGVSLTLVANAYVSGIGITDATKVNTKDIAGP